jgi:hypothetical protein
VGASQDLRVPSLKHIVMITGDVEWRVAQDAIDKNTPEDVQKFHGAKERFTE